MISRSHLDGLVQSVQKLRAAGLSVIVLALAAHTYQSRGATLGREAAFSGHVRRLELAGADVRVVRRPGGVSALAGMQRPANVRGEA